MLYKMGEVSFHFISINSLHVKAENENMQCVKGKPAVMIIGW